MDYVSTRGRAPALGFEGVTLAGLASDGGLYVPRAWPALTREEIAAMAGQGYVDTAVAVMRPFVAGALDDAALRQLCVQAYSGFDHPDVTPLVPLSDGHHLLELFHGPTLAFKDVALQLLGLLFERFLDRTDRPLTVVGATSGDTGSAAIDALAGRANVSLVMLHPQGRVSDVQRRQMTTVHAANVHNVAIDGDFDQAQAIVKALFADAEARQKLNLGAVNSINWARLMAQVVYYFHAAVRLGAPERAVAFSVPTGNFGDVFAGYVASRMGLPVARLIVATNVNDICARALQSGDYSIQGVTPTEAPSMDIQVSSNFERLLFDLAARDGTAVSGMMARFDADKRLDLPPAMVAEAAKLFAGQRIDPDTMAATMRLAHEQHGQLIDPHTAIALAAARAHEGGDTPTVTLATAHPAKFPDAVAAATGVRAGLPPKLAGLFDREERYDVLPATIDAVKSYVLARA